jgi:SSS family solute:Na+ symporter
VFIMIVWVPCILLGIWASSAVFNGQPLIPPGLKNPNAVLGMMVEKLTNPFLAGLLGVGIVSATMALDSQFLCLSTMFTHDVVLHHFGEDRFNDNQKVLMARVFVVATVVVAYLLALGAPRSVFTLGVWCFSGFSSLFPLVVASLYWKRVTKAGAVASIVAAAIAWVLLFRESGWGENQDYLFLGMMSVVIVFAASAVALVAVSLATTPPSPEVIERFFPTAAGRSKPAIPHSGQTTSHRPALEPSMSCR